MVCLKFILNAKGNILEHMRFKNYYFNISIYPTNIEG